MIVLKTAPMQKRRGARKEEDAAFGMRGLEAQTEMQGCERDGAVILWY